MKDISLEVFGCHCWGIACTVMYVLSSSLFVLSLGKSVQQNYDI